MSSTSSVGSHSRPSSSSLSKGSMHNTVRVYEEKGDTGTDTDTNTSTKTRRQRQIHRQTYRQTLTEGKGMVNSEREERQADRQTEIDDKVRLRETERYKHMERESE